MVYPEESESSQGRIILFQLLEGLTDQKTYFFGRSILKNQVKNISIFVQNRVTFYGIIYLVRSQNFWKNIVRIKGVRNVSLSENFTNLLNEWSLCMKDRSILNWLIFQMCNYFKRTLIYYTAGIYLFKVNNKDTRATPMMSFWCLYC